jgi:hypothetical protein
MQTRWMFKCKDRECAHMKHNNDCPNKKMAWFIRIKFQLILNEIRPNLHYKWLLQNVVIFDIINEGWPFDEILKIFIEQVK